MLRAMKKETLAAIEKAAVAVRKGDYHNQFTADWSGRRGHIDKHECE